MNSGDAYLLTNFIAFVNSPFGEFFPAVVIKTPLVSINIQSFTIEATKLFQSEFFSSRNLLQHTYDVLRGCRRLQLCCKDRRPPVDLITLRHVKNRLRILNLDLHDQLLLCAAIPSPLLDSCVWVNSRGKHRLFPANIDCPATHDGAKRGHSEPELLMYKSEGYGTGATVQPYRSICPVRACHNHLSPQRQS